MHSIEMSSIRNRNWFITINNYTQVEKEHALAFTAQYVLVADEVGEKEETPHLHLYIEFKNARSFSKMKKDFPRGNIQIAKGTAQDNEDYLAKQNLIRKEGDPKQQGKRNDISDVIDSIETGELRMRDIVRSATSVQSIRIAEIRMKYFEPKRNWPVNVIWIYGSTGTGKSHLAHSMCVDPFYALDTIHWWEGYDQHEDVIINDFRRDFCKFSQLLKLTDKYPYQVECKGGSRQFLAKRIIITSPLSPSDTYALRLDEDITQLVRRCSQVINMDDNPYVPPENNIDI